MLHLARLMIILISLPALSDDRLNKYLVNCDSGVDRSGYGPPPCFQMNIRDLFEWNDKTKRWETTVLPTGEVMPKPVNQSSKNFLNILRHHYGPEKFYGFLDSIRAEPGALAYVQIPRDEFLRSRQIEQTELLKNLKEARQKGTITPELYNRTIAQFNQDMALDGYSSILEKGGGIKYQELTAKEITSLKKIVDTAPTTNTTTQASDRFLSLEEALILCDYRKPSNTEQAYRMLVTKGTNKCPSLKELEFEYRRAGNGELKRNAALRIRAFNTIDIHSRSRTGRAILDTTFDKVQRYSNQDVIDLKTGLAVKLNLNNAAPAEVKDSPIGLDHDVMTEANTDFERRVKGAPRPAMVSCKSFQDLSSASSEAVKAVTTP